MSPIHAAMVELAPSLLTHTIVFAWKDFEELIVKVCLLDKLNCWKYAVSEKLRQFFQRGEEKCFAKFMWDSIYPLFV